MTYIEIKELSEIIKKSLPDRKLKVIGEVGDPPKISNGSLYFSLKDKTGMISSVIFDRDIFYEREIKEGDKIVVKGKIMYWEKRGNIKFKITKILKHNGIGAMFIEYQKNKKMFKKKGYFLDINKLKIPKIIRKILILTSKGGAAIGDFRFNIADNKSKLSYDIENIKCSGKGCAKNICNKLEKFKNIKYDLIVIMRGGGGKEDFFEFCNLELIEFVYKFKQPILSALGHFRDKSLLDYVADISKPTPSIAAQYIITNNKNYIRSIRKKLEKNRNILIDNKLDKIKKLRELKNKLYEKRNKISKKLRKIENKIRNKISNLPNKKIREINIVKGNFNKSLLIFHRIKINYKEKFKSEINKYILNLENLFETLSKKQNITFYCDGKKIFTPYKLNKKILKNKNIKMVWNNFEYNVKFTKTNLLTYNDNN